MIRRINNQLPRRWVTQVCTIIITTLPQTVCQIYVSLTMNIVKDTLRIVQEKTEHLLSSIVDRRQKILDG